MTTFFETKYALNNKIDTGIKINSFNIDDQINNEIFSFNEEGEEYDKESSSFKTHSRGSMG